MGNLWIKSGGQALPLTYGYSGDEAHEQVVEVGKYIKNTKPGQMVRLR